MLKESQKSLPIKRRIAKVVNDKQNTNKSPMQNIVEYVFQDFQYFQKYRKISKSVNYISKKLKSIYTELDSLSQLKFTKTTKTLLSDLNNRWETVKAQISITIHALENSDYPAMIEQQFNKLQTIIEKVNQSPPSTPILQKESTYMYGSLISQLNNIMSIVKDSSDISNSKCLLQNFRNDISHTCEGFFKNSQVSKTWKRSVIEECVTCIDKIFYYLDFSSGIKVQIPVNTDLISEEFSHILSLEFPATPKNTRSISVTANSESIENNKMTPKKSITQISKISSRSQSAQNNSKSKSYYSLNKKKNDEYVINSENENKNLIESPQLFSRTQSINDNQCSKSVRSSNSSTPKGKKSRLPIRATPDTPQTDIRPVIRNKTLTRLNQFTPFKQTKSENKKIENIVSPTQIGSLLNSPQIHIRDEISSTSEAFPVKEISFPKDEDIFSNYNDVVPLKNSPKLCAKNEGNHSPILQTKNPNKIEFKNLSESVINRYSLEDLISDSDSAEFIAAVNIENEKSPALDKLRQDLASITKSQNEEESSIDLESFQNLLQGFLRKLEENKSLIEANHLLDVLFQLIQKSLDSIQSGKNKKFGYQISKIQNVLSLIEEEYIDKLSLDQLDYTILNIGKEIKNLADSLFKEDPTNPIMDQFESIQNRLKEITKSDANHYFSSEIQKLISMKSQIKEYVETSQQLLKSHSCDRKKLVAEIGSINQRIILLNSNKSNPVFSSEDIENEISDLLNKQKLLIDKLSTIED